MSEPDASRARRNETATPAVESIESGESAESTDSGAGVAVLALSALAFGYAVWLHFADRQPAYFEWLVIALLLCSVGVALLGSLGQRDRVRPFLPGILCLAVLLELFWLGWRPPVVALRGATPSELAPFRFGLALVASLCVAATLAGHRTRRTQQTGFQRVARRVGLGLLLGLHLAMGIGVIQLSHEPEIDVYLFQRDGVRALLDGESPHSITIPNIYPHERYYGSGMVVDGRLQVGYPYLPLTLLAVVPAEILAGDVRYAHLLAMSLAAALMALLAGGQLGLLIAALYLFTPGGFLVIEQSWTEPFVVAALAAMVTAAMRWPSASGPLFGVFLAAKQYCVLALVGLPLLVPAIGKSRDGRSLRPWLLQAAAVAALFTLPFALADPRGFLDSVVGWQFHQPYRPESLSLAVWITAATGYQPPAWLSFAVLPPALWWILTRAPRSPAGFCAGLGFLYLVFFAFAKQAFANYYLLGIGALCCAMAAARFREEETPTSS